MGAEPGIGVLMGALLEGIALPKSGPLGVGASTRAGGRLGRQAPRWVGGLYVGVPAPVPVAPKGALSFP